MNQRVTLADIARETQVSQSTVSLVLRDRPGIPSETRERVLQAAEALGYRMKQRSVKPAGSVSPGPQRKRLSLGVVVKTEPGTSPQANPFYSHVLAGIADACLQMRVNLLYSHLPVDEHNLPVEVPLVLTENHVDGVVLVGMVVTETLRRTLSEGGLSTVLVDAYAASESYDSVLSDNVAGGYEAASYLIQRGHRCIAVLGGGPGAYPSLRERREGFQKALAQARLDPNLCAGCDDYDAAPEAIQRLLAKCPEVTAVFACNDALAIQAMQGAAMAGRRVPDSLSVVGFDDIDTAKYLTPALTTMHVDKGAMGRLAVQLLKNRLDFPDSDRATVVLRPHLIERDSVVARD